MIVATIAFVAAIGGGIYALLRTPHGHQEVANITGDSATPGPRDEGFFYDVVGGGPRVATSSASTGRGEPKSSYTLELKVATSREEAEAAIEAYQKAGIEAYYTPLARGGKVVYRVRRGIYTNQKDANKAALALKDANVGEKVVKLQ